MTLDPEREDRGPLIAITVIAFLAAAALVWAASLPAGVAGGAG